MHTNLSVDVSHFHFICVREAGAQDRQNSRAPYKKRGEIKEAERDLGETEFNRLLSYYKRLEVPMHFGCAKKIKFPHISYDLRNGETSSVNISFLRNA